MTNWSKKYINDQIAAGRIRGAVFTERRKNYSADNRNNIPPKKPKGLIWLDWNLLYWCNERTLSLEKEYRFDSDRKFRFDFCIPALMIAVEYEGGVYQEISGHKTAKHYTKDTDKYNLATELGWRVIRVTAMNYTTVLKSLNELIK